MSSESSGDPYATLMLAVILQAAVDLRSSNPSRSAEARAWLKEDGLSWCQALGISEKVLDAWVSSGFKLQSSAHRNWRYGPADRVASQTRFRPKK